MDAVNKIQKGEVIVFRFSRGLIRIKENSIGVEKNKVKRKYELNSISSIIPYYDGIKLIDKKGEVLVQTKTPFFNRDILVDVINYMIAQ